MTCGVELVKSRAGSVLDAIFEVNSQQLKPRLSQRETRLDW